MFLSEIEKARPKIILFCEMGAVIKRSKTISLILRGYVIQKASLTRKKFDDRIISIKAYKGNI